MIFSTVPCTCTVTWRPVTTSFCPAQVWEWKSFIPVKHVYLYQWWRKRCNIEHQGIKASWTKSKMQKWFDFIFFPEKKLLHVNVVTMQTSRPTENNLVTTDKAYQYKATGIIRLVTTSRSPSRSSKSPPKSRPPVRGNRSPLPNSQDPLSHGMSSASSSRSPLRDNRSPLRGNRSPSPRSEEIQWRLRNTVQRDAQRFAAP